MLLEVIHWKRPNRTWQPPMAVKTRLGIRSVAEGETRFQMDKKSPSRQLDLRPDASRQSGSQIYEQPVLRPLCRWDTHYS
jgi:hypothetical protein